MQSKNSKLLCSVTDSSINIEVFPDKANTIEGLGVVEIDGNKATISYVEAHTTATVIEQFEPLVVNGNVVKQLRGFTVKEIDIIKSAVIEKAKNDLKERIEAIRSLNSL